MLFQCHLQRILLVCHKKEEKEISNCSFESYSYEKLLRSFTNIFNMM
uniref:Uncharacterized protein n=1 Tax=Lepeophtheirus salmonis TaxID=72036 RepID=A0A0K2UNF2_LEPSM